MIEGDDLRLIKSSPKGHAVEQSFNRRWTRVQLEYDEAREIVGRLFLVSRGKHTEIASFLGADERRSLANELNAVMTSPKI